MAEQYISLRVIHDRITKHPLLQSITMDAIITYTIDFMRIVGVPAMFVNKVETVQADNYRVKLPCDYIELIQLKGRNGVYRYTTDTFHLKHHDEHYACTKGCNGRHVRQSCAACDTCPHKATCEYYQFDYNKTECITLLKSVTLPDKTRYGKGNTFMIQNGFIYLSNKCDIVDISYRAILVDDEGMPMIPDNSAFTRALMAYIKQEYFTILFDMNTISQQVFIQAQQDYAWAVGACTTDMNRIDLSKAESMYNLARGLLTKNDEFNETFKGSGDKVILKTH